jgi:hypothetical protein
MADTDSNGPTLVGDERGEVQVNAYELMINIKT